MFPSIDGIQPSYQTVYRWALKGLSGVRLKTVKSGGRRVTRQDWIDEFVERALIEDDQETVGADHQTSRVSRMEREAAKAGI